jgi:flagellar biosynthesis protein FlhG
MMNYALTPQQLVSQTRQTTPQIQKSCERASVAEDWRVKVFAFTSGKGGVGKTHIVVNLAYALGRLGFRVLVLDADLSLANIDVVLGITPQYTLQHVFEGKKTLAEILVPGPAGMLILPASSGLQELAELNDAQRLQLLTALDALEQQIDFMLIDTGTGISDNVMYFNVAAQEIVVVVTPEPPSIIDACALMSVLSKKYAEKHFKVIINAAANASEAKDVFRHLSLTADRSLNVSMDYLGFILHDTAFSQAVRHQKALLDLYPHTAVAQCFHSLVQRFLALSVTPYYPKGNIQFFWRRLLARQLGQPLEVSEKLLP